MDSRTRDAYASHAETIAERHLGAGQGIARYFARAFDPGDRILDVGAGSGRDLADLVSEGWTAYGVEPVAEMRAQALRAHPALEGLLVDGALPDSLDRLSPKLGGTFDGILCSAVLQHLPRHELFDAVFALRDVLRPGGKLLVSIPAFRTGVDASGRDALGRLFTGIAPGELALLCERVGFREIERWESEDSLGRDGTRWATLLFRRERAGAGTSLRPLDRIEAVLQRDKKSSTYKLALLRALTEIATTKPRLASWRPDGLVCVPIEEISDLWLEYYWQLFDSDLFLPQGGGEAKRGVHSRAFTKELNSLRTHFEGAGGLAGFLASNRRGTLDASASALHGALRRKMKTAVQMPLRHAGKSTLGTLFRYEKGHALVEAELWQELTLMSHWIRDSLLVRWAELIGRFDSTGGGNRVRDHALGILLEPALDQRLTRHARSVYEVVPEKECAWSGRRLGSAFDVDHIIPFALWRNNDLWNLVPAEKAVNNQKSDKLPTREILRRRRPIILDYWQRLAEGLPEQFSVELQYLTGGDADPQAGFDALAEAIETTALQRGCKRWP